MKKNARVIAILLTVILMLALAACSGTSGDPKPSETDQGAAQEAGAPFSNASDMAIVYDGKTYPVRVDCTEVLAALGDDYRYSESLSCVYEGYDKTYTYNGIAVSTVPVDGKDVIEMFSIVGEGFTTARGIGVGATRDEVIKAYGEKYYDDGYYLTYTESADPSKINDMRIQFHFDNDVVTEIFVYSPSYSN